MKSDLSKKKVFVAMSGGVDSSVAAYLLKKQGYDVVGVFMRCWSRASSDALGGVGADCTAEADATDARRVAEHIGIPFYAWDFEEEYKKRVVEYMIDGYRRGITPNPDVMCNREIKFGLFLKKALSLGADYIATGHYVRIRATPTLSVGAPTPKGVGVGAAFVATGHYVRIQKGKLFTARDANKDQSYFLWTLTPSDLKHCLFPIGDYLKPNVRAIAKRAGLPTAEKKDSQGICFLGKVSLADFLGHYLPKKKGAVLTAAGEKIGEHSGAHFYTIGQRHGLVSGRWSLGAGKRDRKPLYVAEKNIQKNTLTVAEGNDDPALYRKEITLTDVNFINSSYSHILKNMRIRKNGLRVMARVRYRHPLSEAGLEAEDGKWKLIFAKPQRFVAPGQSAVLYVRFALRPKEFEGRRGSGQSSETFRMIGGGVIR